MRKDGWKRYERAGKPVPLPAGQTPPCLACPKIPKDAPVKHPAYAVELSERNRQAYWHYRQCAAVGNFPDDPIVRRNAALIAAVLQEVRDLKQDRLFYLLGGKL